MSSAVSAASLAGTFFAEFVYAFQSECETNKSAMLPIWEHKSSWTDFMLNPDRGFVARHARAWSVRKLNVPCSCKKEWLKFDLMLVDTSGGSEWWQSVPVVTIEHENDNGIHDEVWKLACWKSRLRILITYHDDEAQAAEKRRKAAQIITNIQTINDGEWLLMSAPRTWGDRLQWDGHEWIGGDWRALGRA